MRGARNQIAFVRRASERLHYSSATVPAADSVAGGQTAKLCESEKNYLVAMTPRYTVVFLHERQPRWSSARVEHEAARAVFAVPTGRRVLCRRRTLSALREERAVLT